MQLYIPLQGIAIVAALENSGTSKKNLVLIIKCL